MDHLDYEMKTAQRVADWTGLRPVKLDEMERADFHLVDATDNVRAVLEVKQRNLRMGSRQDYAISKSKVLSVRNLAKEISATPLLCVHFNDFFWLLNLNRQWAYEKLGGRSDRQEKTNDREMMVHYLFQQGREIGLVGTAEEIMNGTKL